MTNEPIFTHEWMTLDQVYDKYGAMATFKEAFYDLSGGNEALFHLIYGADQSIGYITAMKIITKLGDYHTFPIYLGLCVALMLLGALWRKVMKKGGISQNFTRWAGVLVVLVIGFAANGMMVKTLKEACEMPRPYIALQGVKPLDADPDKGPENDRHSFPSGHTAFMTLIVISLWPVLTARMTYIGLGAIFLVGWSRVALGMHFPADIFWSFLLTSTLVIMLRAVIYKILLAVFKLRC